MPYYLARDLHLPANSYRNITNIYISIYDYLNIFKQITLFNFHEVGFSQAINHKFITLTISMQLCNKDIHCLHLFRRSALISSHRKNNLPWVPTFSSLFHKRSQKTVQTQLINLLVGSKLCFSCCLPSVFCFKVNTSKKSEDALYSLPWAPLFPTVFKQAA